MGGPVQVATRRRSPRRVRLSWPVTKQRGNHTPEFRPTDSNQLRGRERAVYSEALEAFAGIDRQLLLAYIDGDATWEEFFADYMDLFGWFGDNLTRLLHEQFAASAREEVTRIRAAINKNLRRLGSDVRVVDPSDVQKRIYADMAWGIDEAAFDAVNGASARWARTESAQLITNMGVEQKTSIQEAIGRAFTAEQVWSHGGATHGLTRRQTSQALMQILRELDPTTPAAARLARIYGVHAPGLTPGWEKAVMNFADRQAEQIYPQIGRGMSPAKAQDVVAARATRYAEKLRRARARMIARTEIMRASNQGQLYAMRQAINDGLVDAGRAGKMWMTGPIDVCATCEGLMGQVIPVNESFALVGDAPPAHPNCRCVISLVPNIDKAPAPRGIGDPNYPLGTQQNPMVWDFTSGASTAPRVLPTSAPPSAPSAPVPPSGASLEAASRVYQEGGDEGTEALFNYLGFSRQPRVVEADELARLVDESPAGEMRRVVSSATRYDEATQRTVTVEPDEVADGFRRGRDFIGDGAYGRGTYTVEGTAAEFESYVMRTIPNAAQHGSVLEMTLAKDARIYEFVGDHWKAGKKLLDEYAHLGFDDPHQLLAALGYDAVRYARTTESFMVVLNRGKVIVGKAHDAKVGNLRPFGQIPSPASALPPVAPSGPTMAESVMYKPTAKTAKVVDPVVAKIDEVIVAPKPYSSGPTSITLRTKGTQPGEAGFFSPKRKIPMPSEPTRPRIRSAYATQAEYDAAVAKYEAAYARYRERMADYFEAKGVRSQIETFGKGTADDIGDMQNALGHEWGHRLDYVEDVVPASGPRGFARTVERSRMKDAFAEMPQGGFAPRHGVSGEFTEEIAFLKAAAESDAVATLLRVGGKIDPAWVEYATSPHELWARAFSQWLATTNGTPQMAAAMTESIGLPAAATVADVAAGGRWYGFQWRADEFAEKIAPLVEQVLRKWGLLA